MVGARRAETERTSRHVVHPRGGRAHGATAAAILAGALLIPAAVAAADELPETAPDAVVEELQDSEPTEPGRPPADETPASVDGDELADQAADADTVQREAARSETDDTAADAPAPAADEPQTEISEIAPGDTLELRHEVVGARNVYLYVIGPDLEVHAQRPDSLISIPASGTNVHGGEYGWTGRPDGTWSIRITNHGAQPVTPAYGFSYDTPYGWYSAPVTVTITMSDAGSGVVALNYTLDDGPTLASTTATTRLEFGDDGEHVLRCRARDHQWNWSEIQELAFKIDRTAPIIALHGLVEGARYEVGEDVFVEYQCGGATSGLVGDDCIADQPSDARIDTSTPGDHVFHIEATDLAGNRTFIDRRYSVVAGDTTDPVVEVDVPEVPASGWYLDEVTVRLTASDEGGIRRIHYEYGTMQTTVSRDVEGDTAEVTFDRTQLYSLTFWAEDEAGNRSEAQTLDLRVDSDAPWIDVHSPDEDELSILPNGHVAQHERVVTYTVDAAPAPGGGAPGGAVGGGRVLATTGASDVAPGLALAVILLGAGAAIAVRRRVRTR